jgi:hypothetical protein
MDENLAFSHFTYTQCADACTLAHIQRYLCKPVVCNDEKWEIMKILIRQGLVPIWLLNKNEIDIYTLA